MRAPKVKGVALVREQAGLELIRPDAKIVPLTARVFVLVNAKEHVVPGAAGRSAAASVPPADPKIWAGRPFAHQESLGWSVGDFGECDGPPADEDPVGEVRGRADDPDIVGQGGSIVIVRVLRHVRPAVGRTRVNAKRCGESRVPEEHTSELQSRQYL